jgi:hypothetical protein
VAVADGAVTFRYKDYADDHRSKVMTLSAVEFLRRFVQHVLPGGFVKVRSYGLMSNRFRAERLTVVRRLLVAATVVAAAGVGAANEPLAVEPVRERCCASCGRGRLECVALPREGADSS